FGSADGEATISMPNAYDDLLSVGCFCLDYHPQPPLSAVTVVPQARQAQRDARADEPPRRVPQNKRCASGGNVFFGCRTLQHAIGREWRPLNVHCHSRLPVTDVVSCT